MVEERKSRITEIATIVGVVATVMGGMLVFASNATDRIALIEERIAGLRIDVDKIEHGDPLVNARLERMRADLEALEHRVDVLNDKARTMSARIDNN